MKADRATAIRQLLFTQGHLPISEIAQAVGASEPTVRRDLIALETEGIVTRTHGGARIADASSPEIAFETREQMNLAAKRLIGAAAHDVLQPGTAVFLDSGTTVMQLARMIRLQPMALRVFTNCLPVAQLLMPVPDLTVTLLGGTLRMQNASLVGPLAEAALADLWFDQLFLGVSAVMADLAIYSADAVESRLNRLMASRAAHTVVLTDSSKFGLQATHRIVGIGKGMHVITDSALAADWQAQIARAGARLSRVETPP